MGYYLTFIEPVVSQLLAATILVGYGDPQYNEEQLEHGEQAVSLLQFVTTSQFWYESFQNWQSEFLSVGVLAVLSIFLRQRGFPGVKARGRTARGNGELIGGMSLSVNVPTIVGWIVRAAHPSISDRITLSGRSVSRAPSAASAGGIASIRDALPGLCVHRLDACLSEVLYLVSLG